MGFEHTTHTTGKVKRDSTIRAVQTVRMLVLTDEGDVVAVGLVRLRSRWTQCYHVEARVVDACA